MLIATMTAIKIISGNNKISERNATRLPSIVITAQVNVLEKFFAQDRAD